MSAPQDPSMKPFGKWLCVISALAAGPAALAQPAQLRITTTSLPTATEGTQYSQQLSATGGVTPYTWTLNTDVGSIPPGLSLSSSGVISGVPTTPGAYRFGVIVFDNEEQQQSASATISMSVISPPLTITSSSPL